MTNLLKVISIWFPERPFFQTCLSYGISLGVKVLVKMESLQLRGWLWLPTAQRHPQFFFTSASSNWYFWHKKILTILSPWQKLLQTLVDFCNFSAAHCWNNTQRGKNFRCFANPKMCMGYVFYYRRNLNKRIHVAEAICTISAHSKARKHSLLYSCFMKIW